jgi:hypothetical protein
MRARNLRQLSINARVKLPICRNLGTTTATAIARPRHRARCRARVLQAQKNVANLPKVVANIMLQCLRVRCNIEFVSLTCRKPIASASGAGSVAEEAMDNGTRHPGQTGRRRAPWYRRDRRWLRFSVFPAPVRQTEESSRSRPRMGGATTRMLGSSNAAQTAISETRTPTPADRGITRSAWQAEPTAGSGRRRRSILTTSG